MFLSLGMIWPRSFPPSRQQTVEKPVYSREIIIDLLRFSYSEYKLVVVEQIPNLVVKDSAVDAFQRLAMLNKNASFCVRTETKPISFFIGRFVSPAQATLNLASIDKASAKSQNLAMTFLPIANLSSEMLTLVMSSVVSSSKNSVKHITPSISTDSKRLETVKCLLFAIISGCNVAEIF